MEILLGICLFFIVFGLPVLLVLICCGLVIQLTVEAESALKGDKKAVVRLVCLALLGSLFLD